VEDQIPPEVLALARAFVASGLGVRCAGKDEPTEAERPPWTVAEAAAHLKVHESTLYRAIQAGSLGAYSVGSGGRAIRIPDRELGAFKARRMIRSRTGPRAVA